MRRLPLILALSAMPALAADQWTRLTTPDLELYTAAGEKQGRDTIRHLEQVREFFLKASPVRISPDFPLRIIQFDTESQYKPFRAQETSIAYFVATPARDYIVMGNQASKDYGPSIHEYMHLIVRHSGLKLPTWLDEGWADVFSTLRPMGKDTAVGDLLPERMKSLASDRWLDFDILTSVNSSSPIYHEASRVGIFYAESWALAHMLYLAPEYKDNFEKFVLALHNGQSASRACETAFGRSSNEIFQDLHSYFDRKRIYGRVFETRFAKGETDIAVSAVPEFDSRLVLADLLVYTNKRGEAKAEYARLELEQPDRPDLNQSIGTLALLNRDTETARRYFAKAYDAGNSNPQMCFQLAVLQHDAKQPPAKIIPILQRALESEPGYTDAKVQLGLTFIDARNYSNAVSILNSIPSVTPKHAPVVFCGLAYAVLQTGDPPVALGHARTCRKWARTDVDINRADRIIALIEARSKPSAAVRPGEALQRTAGTARSLQCSSEGNRLQVAIGNRLVTFDLPEAAAVELPLIPSATLTLTCGTLPAIRMGIEFAPPRSAIETSAGIVRRLEF